MYNQDQKSEYIKSVANTVSMRKYYTSVFTSVEKYEEALGMDICSMNQSQLNSVINSDSILSLRYHTREVLVSVLRNYGIWCLGKKVPNALSDITTLRLPDAPADGQSLKDSMLSSPIHLQQFLDSIFLPESDLTIDNVFRTYCWMLFAGMNKEDTVRVRVENVDLDVMEIRFEGYYYPIYREGVPAIRNCMRLNQFREFRQKGGIAERNRVDGDILLRGEGRLDLLYLRIKDAIIRAKAKAFKNGRTSLNPSSASIKLSGIFYRTYMDELAGVPADFYHIVDRYNSCKRNPDRTRAAKGYSMDYISWKNAFVYK